MAHALPSNILDNCDSGFLMCFAEYLNSVTYDMFWVLTLLAFCVILFMATARLGTSRALGYSSFVGLIGAIWLAVMELMAWYLASIFIIAGGLGIAIMIMSGDR